MRVKGMATAGLVFRWSADSIRAAREKRSWPAFPRWGILAPREHSDRVLRAPVNVLLPKVSRRTLAYLFP